MSSRIPDSSRKIVTERDRGRCVRCLMPGREWHHRRGKSVVDEHRHCPCNGVILCGNGNVGGCHGYVHSRPFEARAAGLIVLRSVALPYTVPFRLGTTEFVLPDCSGGARHVEALTMEMALELFEQPLVD